MKLVNFISNHFHALTRNPVLSGSVVMVVGTNVHNIGQLFYHFLSGRLLGKAFYGDLAAIISLFGLLAIVQQSLGLAVVKFISSSKEDKESQNLAKWVNLWGILGGAILAIFLLVISPVLSDFLNLGQKYAIYLFAPAVLFAFISNTGRSLLLGFLKFKEYVLSMIVEVAVKIGFTVALVYLGYALFGAMMALVISALVGLIIVWFSIRDKVKGERGAMPSISPIVKFAVPVLIQSVALTSMYSSDILLVKRLFSAEDAGLYAALAKLGTIAMFAAAPITSVMFPLVVRKHSLGESYKRIFYLSLALVTSVSLAVVLVYSIFSEFIVGTLFGLEFVDGSNMLWWFGLYMLLLGIAILFTQFYLSIGKTKIVWLFAAAAVLQVILIVLNHNTLLQVIQVSATSAALLVTSLLIYFPYHQRNEK